MTSYGTLYLGLFRHNDAVLIGNNMGNRELCAIVFLLINDSVRCIFISRIHKLFHTLDPSEEQATARLSLRSVSSTVFNNDKEDLLSALSLERGAQNADSGAGTACLLERRTRDRKGC